MWHKVNARPIDNPAATTCRRTWLTRFYKDDRDTNLQATREEIWTHIETDEALRASFEYCLDTLKNVIQTCTKVQFSRLAMVISCLLSSRRPLHQIEMIAAMRLCLESEKSTDLESTSIMCLLPHAAALLVNLDPAGNLALTTENFRKFFEAHHVRGIDRTAATIARLCLTQLMTCHAHQHRIPPSECACAFSAYASVYWKEHYRAVQHIYPDATRLVHRILLELITSNKKQKFDKSDIQEPRHDLRGLSQNQCRSLLELCQRDQFTVLQGMYTRVFEKTGCLIAPGHESVTAQPEYDMLDWVFLDDITSSEAKEAWDDWVELE